jgi:hypothetical protein
MKYANKFLKVVWCVSNMINRGLVIPRNVYFMLVIYLVFVSSFFVASFIFPPYRCSNIAVLLSFEPLFYVFQYVFVGMLLISCVASLFFIVQSKIKGASHDR